MTVNPLIDIKNLTISYGDNVVIKAASFNVVEGDFICVVGANGSGKSTLIKSILKLIKPSSGSIIFSNDITPGSIGFMPQEPRIDSVFPATVSEIVLSGTLGNQQTKFFYRKENRTRAEEAMKKLRISNLANKSYSELSGGQKQKVLLARALSATNKLLILDEPSNNLDHDSRKSFYQTLQKLNQNGLTIIMITHDLDADDLIGNKVLAIQEGNVSLHTTKDYLRSFK